MSKEVTGNGYVTKRANQPHQVRLPGFLIDDDKAVGLGDVIKRATSAVGIKPCDGCKRRAAILNSWLVFSGRHPR